MRVVQGLISAADQSDGFSSDSYSYLKNGLWWAGMLTSKSLISTLLHSLWGDGEAESAEWVLVETNGVNIFSQGTTEPTFVCFLCL